MWQSGAADWGHLVDGSADALRANVNVWLDDDSGQLPGAWRNYRAAFVPKAMSYDIVNHFPIIPSDPMEGVFPRALLAKHTNGLEPTWLCADGFVRSADAGATSWRQRCLPKRPKHRVDMCGS